MGYLCRCSQKIDHSCISKVLCCCHLVNGNHRTLICFQMADLDTLATESEALLDTPALYLECDDDDSYQVPAANVSLSRPSSDSVAVHFKLSFPRNLFPSDPERYVCDACDQSFPRASLLLDHQAQQHQARASFACPACTYKGSLRRHLMQHMKRAHDKERFKDLMRRFEAGLAASTLSATESKNPPSTER